MKQTAYQVVSWDDRNRRQDNALFEHESEARTYALAAAQAGHSACVLKIETEVLASYPPETASGA